MLLAIVCGYEVLKGGKALIDMLNTALRGTAVNHLACPRVAAVEHHNKPIDTRQTDNYDVKNA
jgi:molybdopterin-guanine dinucleotide biosynthesis protein